MRRALSVLLLAAIGSLVATLALSPFHRVHSAAECRAAYAAAQSRLDSIAVQFKPLAQDGKAVNSRCSSVVGVRVAASAQDVVGR